MNHTATISAEGTVCVARVSSSVVGTIDCLRIFAALAIVWIHTPRSELLESTVVLGRFAVPFFVFSAIYFATMGGFKVSQRTLGRYAFARFRRLYLPFLVWSAAYLGLKGIKLVLAPDQQNDFPGWSLLLVGSAYHLWFLPFILFGSIVAFALAKNLAANNRSIPITCVVIGVAAALIDPSNWPVHDGFRFMWQALPALCWAMGYAFVEKSFPDRRRVPSLWLAFAFGLGMACLATAGRLTILENALGAWLFVLGLRSQDVRLPTVFHTLAPLSFGIYLSHLVFIKTFETITNKLHLAPTVALDLILFLATVLGSVLLSKLILRSQRTSWIV